MTTIRSGVNERALLAALPSVFTSSLTWISELAQNARRAGASYVTFRVVQDSESANTRARSLRVFVEDDGSGIYDPSVLLNLGVSGWDDVTKLTETPFGMGFTSAVMAATYVDVTSHFGSVTITSSDLIMQRPIEVDTHAPRTTGSVVCLHFCDTAEASITVNGISREIHKRLDRFPIQVFCESAHELRAAVNNNTRGTGQADFARFYSEDMCITYPTAWSCFLSDGYLQYRLSIPIYVQGIRTDNTFSSFYQLSAIELGDSYMARFPDRTQLLDYVGTVSPRIDRALKGLITVFIKKAVTEVLVINDAPTTRHFVGLLHRRGLPVDSRLEINGFPTDLFSVLTTGSGKPDSNAHDFVAESFEEGFKSYGTHFTNVGAEDGISVLYDAAGHVEAYDFLQGFVQAVLAESKVCRIVRTVSPESRLAAAVDRSSRQVRARLGILSPEESWHWESPRDARNFEVTAQAVLPAIYNNMRVVLGDTLVLERTVGCGTHVQKFIFTNRVTVQFKHPNGEVRSTRLADMHILPVCRFKLAEVTDDNTEVTDDDAEGSANIASCNAHDCSSSDEDHDVVIVWPDADSTTIAETLRNASSHAVRNTIETAVLIAGDFTDHDGNMLHDMHRDNSVALHLDLIAMLGLSAGASIKHAILNGVPLHYILDDDSVRHDVTITRLAGDKMADIVVNYTRTPQS